ncbi:integrating conjugative element protein [Pseudomonas sp. PIC25]|uniref:TIGR03749 family integrating conjugative element protein n=1 Tax=Pseudomonas sp. PIC25 TaxID=1958773 RepID=UPI000BAB8228|nr:TIGR03749 family integrating conjugative element protein [Pseudomonas sp. PIC25]PAU51963.1 integrating conjugative element protein [Pseudomonas sp. PIC25]
MKRPVVSSLAVVLLMMAIAPIIQAVEVLRWERLPLAVPLVVGQERVIFLDRNVRVGVPSVVSTQLRVQIAGGAVYLLAREPIAPTRLQLQDTDSGALILLDIAAQAAKDGQPPMEPVRIVEGDVPAKRYGGTNADDQPGSTLPANDDTSRPIRETPVPVILTRYAAQNLYAPLRTVEPVAGIQRARLDRNLALETLLPTLPVRAQALAAWRLEDLWVTAVRLTNTSAHWLDLDPRTLQGDFVAATFQHPSVGPAGASTDTTVVYLVTRGHGLAESLLPTISPIDAALNLPSPPSRDGAEGADHEE